jgi:signal transduction histidine kinase
MNLSDNILIIDVIDEGFGIPEEDQKHIFERFFRANNAGNIQGTGLGLNIVKKYIDIMGGTISFKSNCETGSTFTIKLSF